MPPGGMPPGPCPRPTLTGAANLRRSRRQNSMGRGSRGEKPRAVQGCCEGCCAWILLVLVGCGRAAGAVELAERGRDHFLALGHATPQSAPEPPPGVPGPEFSEPRPAQRRFTIARHSSSLRVAGMPHTAPAHRTTPPHTAQLPCTPHTERPHTPHNAPAHAAQLPRTPHNAPAHRTTHPHAAQRPGAHRTTPPHMRPGHDLPHWRRPRKTAVRSKVL